jgi:serpin B
MKRRIIAIALSLGLILSSLFPLSGCGVNAKAVDLMAGLERKTISPNADLKGDSSKIAEFAVELFKKSVSDKENSLVSPLSVLCALAMTANGAKDETLSQMEDVLGLPVGELNNYLQTYMANLPSGDKYKVSLANSIWFKDDEKLSVKKDFLQTNADYYNASIYKSAFDDAALKTINDWVKDNTDGMIPEILDSIPENAVMYLINALAFDAEWQEIYNEIQVRDGTFTTEDGKSENVKLMYSDESRYLDNGNATGFIKYYADQKYAFAALLPNEGISFSDYISSLSGESIMNTLNNAKNETVRTAIPKFKSEYSISLEDILADMGMNDAFDADRADFTGLGEYVDANIFISRVLHKTFISVDERGTKAGAATVVEMEAGSAMVEEPKTVYLDRPFIYMLIDCETNLPIFIGSVLDLEE